MYRRLFTAAALLLAGLFSLVLGIRPTAAESWVSTGTQGMTLTNATDLGALPASTPVTVRVALKLNNPPPFISTSRRSTIPAALSMSRL